MLKTDHFSPINYILYPFAEIALGVGGRAFSRKPIKTLCPHPLAPVNHSSWGNN